MLDYAIVKDLYAHDPDGRETEPRPGDYDRFRAWVIEGYGLSVWQAYSNIYWDPQEG